MRNYFLKLSAISALIGAGTIALPASAAIDVSAVVTSLTTDGTAAVTSIGVAALTVLGVVAVFKWVRRAF